MFEFQTWRFFGRSGPCFCHLLFYQILADGIRHYCRSVTGEMKTAKPRESGNEFIELRYPNKSIIAST